jgi:hypothetical protein
MQPAPLHYGGNQGYGGGGGGGGGGGASFTGAGVNRSRSNGGGVSSIAFGDANTANVSSPSRGGATAANGGAIQVDP